MSSRLVKDSFTNIHFKSYKIDVANHHGFFEHIPRNAIITNEESWFKKDIELEPFVLSLLKTSIKKFNNDDALLLTQKWGFLDFKHELYKSRRTCFWDNPLHDEVKDTNLGKISKYREDVYLWTELILLLNYIFNFKDYTLENIWDNFRDDEDLSSMHYIRSHDDINWHLKQRVFPSLSLTDETAKQDFRVSEIDLDTYSLFGAALIFAIDNYFKEIRQCKGPNCKQIFFVKRKGRMFCEPNGRCAKAFERLNKR